MRAFVVTTGLAATVLLHQAGWAGDAGLKKLVMLEPELIDKAANGAVNPADKERLGKASAALRQEFMQRRLYNVVENAPAQALIDDLTSRYSLLECDDCVRDIGKALNADRVMTSWVQKVSEQTLNINIQITDAATGNAVTNKSVFIRNNTDDGWLRGIRHMVRSIEEKKQANK